MRGAAAGKAFLDGVLAKIADPGAREAAARAFADATVQLEVGNGVAGQAEIDRQLQDLRTRTEALDTRQTELTERETSLTNWHTGLTTWRDQNAAALEEYNRLKREGKLGTAPAPTAPTATPAPTGLTEEQIRERELGLQASILGFARDQNELMREHFGKFNEILHLEPLLRHPQIKDLGLVGVYGLVHKERLDKYATDAQAAHDKKVGEEAIRKHQEAQAQMPYPSPTGVGSGSPLDALVTPGKDGVVDAATAHYNRLVQERMANGAGA